MAGEQDLVLTPPAPVPVVTAEKAAGLVPLNEGQKPSSPKRVEVFIDELVSLDANSPAFGEKVAQLTDDGPPRDLGRVRALQPVLDRPVKAMNKDSGVGADLTALRRTVEELIPANAGQLTRLEEMLGVLPVRQQTSRLLRRVQVRAIAHRAVLERLASGKDELLKDNAAIDVERQALGAAMG